jgi:hypothetical protein
MTNTKGMDTTKQTAVDFLMDKLFDPSMMVDEQVKWFEQAKEMQKKQSQQYAEFCVMCDRENLPLLDFESYILKYGGNN